MCTALMALASALAAAPTAYVRGSDGQWVPLPAQDQDGAVVVQIGPEQAASGSTAIVVNKPEWMELNDYDAPVVVAARIGDEGLSLGDGIDLGALGSNPPPLTIRVADAANPINPEGLRLDIPGVDDAPHVVAPGLEVPAKTAEITVQLPRLRPGAYEGILSVADLSPQTNTLRLPLHFAVFGIEPDMEASRVVLASPSASYEMTAGSKLPVRIDAAGQSAYVTSQIDGTWMYPRGVQSVEMLEDSPERAVCKVTTGVGDAPGNEVDKPGTYEYEFEVRNDLPCLFVTSRILNEVADGDVYSFWGWLRGEGFDTADGHHDWSMTYTEIGAVGWVYLPPKSGAGSGIGWVSPLVFGESRFGTMLLYTSPTRLPCKVGESIPMRFAIMPANSPDEVRQVAEKIDELGVW